MEALVTDFLQSESLLDIEGCDVRFSESETLFQSWVTLKNIFVTGNLNKSR